MPAAQGGAPVLIRADDIRAETVGENASRPIFGKMKRHRGAGHRAARFVGDLYCQWPGAAGAGSVHTTFPFYDLNLKNGDLSRRRTGKR